MLISADIIFIAIALGLKLAALNRGLVIYDVGEVTWYVDKILSGQQAGIDYVVNSYGFGRYGLFAILFMVFGKSLTILNLTWILIQTAAVYTALRISRRFLPGLSAYVPLIPFVFVPGPIHKSMFLFFTVTGALFAIRYVEKPGRSRAIQYCVLALAALLARPDLGVMLAFGFLVIAVFLKPENGFAEKAKHLAVVYAPMAVMMILVFVVLVAKGTVGPIYQQLADEIGKNTSITFPAFPVPSDIIAGGDRWLEALMIYFYIGIYVIGIAVAIKDRFKFNKENNFDRSAFILLVLFGLMASNQVRIKSDFSHMLQAAPLAYLTAGALAYRAYLWIVDRHSNWKVAGEAVLGGLLFMVFFLTATNQLLYRANDVYTGSVTTRMERIYELHAGGATIRLDKYELERYGGVIDFIAENSPGCDSIWVPTNQPMYYFLTGKKDVTGYPAVVFYAYSEAKQEQVIQRLKDSPPAYTVFVDDTIEGDYLKLSNAAPLVYDFMMYSFEPVKKIGDAWILKRIGVPDGKSGCGT